MQLYFISSTVWAAESNTGTEIIKGLNKQFTASPKQPIPYWFPVTVTVFILLFVIWVVYKIYSYSQKIDADNPWSLYKQLCKVHHLSFIEKRVIYKVLHENQLSDPLPLFVEPEYLKKAINDDSLKNDHDIIQNIFDKLFQPKVQQQANQSNGNNDLPRSPEVKELFPEPPTESARETMEQMQSQEKNIKEEIAVSTQPSYSDFEKTEIEKMPDKNEENISLGATQEENPISFEHGKSNGKVLLSPIPGGKAFFSLAEPVGQISSEIAAVAIQYNLSNGYGLNSRSFESIHRQQHEAESEMSPHLFPKSQTPPTMDVLSEQRISRTDKHAVISPTPKYLQEKRSAGNENTKNRSENIGRLHLPKSGEMFTMEDIHLLESIIMKR
ncbi:MAG: hypothetical protein LBJ67_11515 [Planctomycetaceae bacterium]|nr:hypothetical protein [Planctomycetaceae bacterium]